MLVFGGVADLHPRKFNSSDHLPTIIFQGRAVKFRGCKSEFDSGKQLQATMNLLFSEHNNIFVLSDRRHQSHHGSRVLA